MIVRVKSCATCSDETRCAHTGARWLCAGCWKALMDAPWPERGER